MATKISTVTDRGQVSIPASLRKELSLSQGQRLLWQRSGERELRVTILGDEKPKGARAMLGFAKTFRETRTTEEWMAELREGEADVETSEES